MFKAARGSETDLASLSKADPLRNPYMSAANGNYNILLNQQTFSLTMILSGLLILL
jgi:hypothetical protein